jgi:uncharacterized protein YmfQ (DUF2313 family)
MTLPFINLTSSDYLQAAQALLPRGLAWPRDPLSTLTRFFDGVATNLYKLGHLPLATLFGREMDPTQTDWLLPDWETSWGITPRGSKSARRTRLVEVIADPGGFSVAHYEALADQIGISITTAVTGPFAWVVYAPSSLSAADRAALEAVITTHNRATCVVSFIYDVMTDDSGETLTDDSGHIIAAV